MQSYFQKRGSSQSRHFGHGVRIILPGKDTVAQLMARIENKMVVTVAARQDVRLLVFYDQAWIHNSRIFVPLARNAEIAAEQLRGVNAPFRLSI